MKHSIKCSIFLVFFSFFALSIQFAAETRLKGKLSKGFKVDFRPAAAVILPDGTGFIQTDIPYEIIRWDFKTMKELGSVAVRQAETAALLYDGRDKIYRITYQGIEIYNSATGRAEGEMRPVKSPALGGVFDQESGNLIALGTRSIFFIDPETKKLLAETPIAAGSRITGASIDEPQRTLYAFIQPGEGNRALAVPVDLDRFTAGESIDLGEANKYTQLLYAMRPTVGEGREEFYLSGELKEEFEKGERTEKPRLYIKASADSESSNAIIELFGSVPPKIIFSPNGQYFAAFEKSGFSIIGEKGKPAGAGKLALFRIDSTPTLLSITDRVNEPRAAVFSSDSAKLYVFDGAGEIFVIE